MTKRNLKRNLIFWHDPGHGWLIVPKKDLIDLGIASKISSYSYVFKDNILLEEDCDAEIYWNAAEALGWEIKVTSQEVPRYIHNVRDLPSYRGV